MLIKQCFYGFEFNNNYPGHDQIGIVFPDFAPPESNLYPALCFHLKTCLPECQEECILIYLSQKSIPEFIVNLIVNSNDFFSNVCVFHICIFKI